MSVPDFAALGTSGILAGPRFLVSGDTRRWGPSGCTNRNYPEQSLPVAHVRLPGRPPAIGLTGPPLPVRGDSGDRLPEGERVDLLGSFVGEH